MKACKKQEQQRTDVFNSIAKTSSSSTCSPNTRVVSVGVGLLKTDEAIVTLVLKNF
jgi:hypothetical protein